jgi:acyl-CoA synthetase (AMP-forming)/AMP-acid ligase II
MSTASELLSQRVPDSSNAGLVDLVLRAAEHYPNSGLFTVSDERQADADALTYPALLAEARRILGGLQAVNHRSQSKVVLLLERARDFIPAFWACVLGGYIPCPMVPVRGDPERWLKHLAHVNGLLDEPLFVSTGKLRRDLPEAVLAADLDVLRKGSPTERVHRSKITDPAILVLTSGSTGNAKAVVLTHGNLLQSMAGKNERQRLNSTDISLNWISFDHVAALLETHLLPLFVGASQVHVDPAMILAEPLLFLRLIDRFRVTMSFSPNFLFVMCEAHHLRR